MSQKVLVRTVTGSLRVERQTCRIVFLSFSLGALGLAACASAPPGHAESRTEGLCPSGTRPSLVISLEEGTLVAELFDSAAPAAVRRITSLADQGHYDGQAFDYTRPHFEIITSDLEAEDPILLDKELDPIALGLDKVTIDDIDRATDTFQLEIFRAFAKNKKQPATPRLKTWLESWENTKRADFLLGVSRQEINEALGYVYGSGFDSRPVTKGSLTLKPASKTQSTPRLSIALADFPQRTGRHVVIGHMREGLERADHISTRPFDVPEGRRSYDHRPRDPVVIKSIRSECRTYSAARRREP